MDIAAPYVCVDLVVKKNVELDVLILMPGDVVRLPFIKQVLRASMSKWRREVHEALKPVFPRVFKVPWHYGIYVGHMQAEQHQVINYHPGGVESEGIRKFYGQNIRELQIVQDDRWQPYPSQHTVRRARSALSNAAQAGGYDSLWRNCEHFAYFCKYGRAISGQLEDVAAVVLILPVLLLGVTLNIAFWKRIDWASHALSFLGWNPYCFTLRYFLIGIVFAFQAAVGVMPLWLIGLLTSGFEVYFWGWPILLGQYYCQCWGLFEDNSLLLQAQETFANTFKGRIYVRRHRHFWVFSRLDLHWPLSIPVMILMGHLMMFSLWSHLTGWRPELSSSHVVALLHSALHLWSYCQTVDVIMDLYCQRIFCHRVFRETLVQ